LPAANRVTYCGMKETTLAQRRAIKNIYSATEQLYTGEKPNFQSVVEAIRAFPEPPPKRDQSLTVFFAADARLLCGGRSVDVEVATVPIHAKERLHMRHSPRGGQRTK